MTLTECKRNRFPGRYIRKDARTRVYRAVYGIIDPGKRSNDPAVDTRHLPDHWNYHDAEQIYKANLMDAMFTHVEIARLERRLDMLRQYKSRN